MRKGTIFKYELKRLLLSKEYLLLLIATLFYSVSLLRSMVLFGTNYTAPFSQLTFSTYCASLTPFLSVLLLLLCARQFKASERGAEAIISAAPMPIKVFRLLRYAAIGCAYLIAVILSVAICLCFYLILFKYSSFGTLIWSAVLIFLPSSLLLFGIAMALGYKHVISVYIILAAVLVIGVFNIKLPSWMDIIGITTAIAPDDGQVSELSSIFTFSRAAFFMLGLGLTAVSLRTSRVQGNKD